MDKKEIIVGDFKIKRIDSLSWQVFERREIGKSNNPNTKSREGEVDWVGLPAYFGTLVPALVKAKELNRNDKMASGELKDAIASIEKADEEFLEAVKKAVVA